MSIEGQGHFFTIYFPGFVCFVLYLAKISGERLQDHWSSGFDIICKLCFARFKSWSREKSENIICLDPYILNSFSYLDPISINVSQLC